MKKSLISSIIKVEILLQLLSATIIRGDRMTEVVDVECKYCGALIKLRKAVRLNPETGKYEYACVNCAMKFNKMEFNKQAEPLGVEKSIQ